MEKQRVLVVDDDREIVNAIAINLQHEGYEVLMATDWSSPIEQKIVPLPTPLPWNNQGDDFYLAYVIQKYGCGSRT